VYEWVNVRQNVKRFVGHPVKALHKCSPFTILFKGALH